MRRTHALALGLLLAACSRPDHIEINPRQPLLRSRGESVQLSARVMSKSYELVKQRIEWSSKDPKVATVNEYGVVRPAGSGIARIVARSRGLEAEVPVEVSLVEELKSDTTLIELSYEKGDPGKPHVQALGYDGRVLRDRPIFFTSRDTRVCNVDGSGQFWPVEKGETVVVGKIEDKEIEIRCVVGK